MTVPFLPQFALGGGQATIDQLNTLFDALRPVMLFALIKRDGFNGTFFGGRYNGADLASQVITFPASSTRYVEASTSTGAISHNTTGYASSGTVKLGVLVTNSTGILSWTPENRIAT